MFKTGKAKASALLDILKYGKLLLIDKCIKLPLFSNRFELVDGKFVRHDLSDPIVPHNDITDRTAPIHSMSPTMVQQLLKFISNHFAFVDC